MQTAITAVTVKTAVVRAISKVTNKEFGSDRVVSDIIMVSAAAILCVIFLHNLSGAREGTIIAALLTEIL